MSNKFLIFDYIWRVQDHPKPLSDSGEVPISEWSGWQFDSQCEIFSLLDKKKEKEKEKS